MPQTRRLRRHERERLWSERGQTFVEFALILPLLLILVFGVLDLGKALGYKNDLTNLANQAARAAAVNQCPGTCSGCPVSCSGIAQWIQYQAPSAELTSGGGSIAGSGLGAAAGTPPVSTATTFTFTGVGSAGDPNYCVGDPVQAKVQVTYNFLGALLKKPLAVLPFPSVTLAGSATMRLETNYDLNTGNDAYFATGLQPPLASGVACPS